MMKAVKAAVGQLLGRRRSVLIVDDEAHIRDFVRVLLEDARLGPFYEAADGETALHLAHQHQPSIVLLDYVMPGMDGSAVAGYLRKIAPQARIVLLTAKLDSAPPWADDFLHKMDISRLPDLLRGREMSNRRAIVNRRRRATDRATG